MLGKNSSEARHRAPSRPGISVLIRTYNSARTLDDVLKRLPLQKHDELIVVDSGSMDSTLSIAEFYHAHIIRLDCPFNYSAALNRGFEAATNEWVLVISSHSIPQSQSLIEIVRNFSSSAPDDFVVGYGICHVSALAASAHHESGNEQAEKEFRCLQVSEIGGNGLAVYRKSAWLQHKFNEQIATAEDLEWFLWAQSTGYKARRISGAKAIYRNQGSLAHMFRKGWNEVRQAEILLPRQAPSMPDIIYGWFIGNLHFFKLSVKQQLPFGSMLRQQSHLLGASLARLLVRSQSY